MVTLTLLAMLPCPPPITDCAPEAIFCKPPPIVAKLALGRMVFALPPPVNDWKPAFVLFTPPMRTGWPSSVIPAPDVTKRTPPAARTRNWLLVMEPNGLADELSDQ